MAGPSRRPSSRIHASHLFPRCPRGVMVVATAEVGLEIARRHPAVRVQVFERDWRAVDAGRALADAAGLGGRVTVHHRGAAALANEPGPPAAAA